MVAEVAAGEHGWQQPPFPATLIRDACFSLPLAICLAATSIPANGGLSFIQARSPCCLCLQTDQSSDSLPVCDVADADESLLESVQLTGFLDCLQ